MTDVFFMATKQALDNITSTYDMVWPTAVGLWNLRCMVNDVRKEFPAITEPELDAKFAAGSGIRGVNYKRAFAETSWAEQQSDFAWILLNSTIPIFEGWLEELERTRFRGMKVKDLQFPGSAQAELARLKTDSSLILRNAFYHTYSAKRDRCFAQLDALLCCYRVFKEARNCFMHNGSIADRKLLNAYTAYLPFATEAELCVEEVPAFPAPVLGEKIQLSLRGVVGFSYILIKILVTMDTELLCAKAAEAEFLDRYRQKHTILRTLKQDEQAARRQIQRYVMQCGFPMPQNGDDMIAFLSAKGLVKQSDKPSKDA